MAEQQDTAVETYDVCIVGAGLCGLNALAVASEYLSPNQKIAFVDRRASVGGMWIDVYPYVRLHQPHPMFTAGNIKWTQGKPPSHLADKSEVLDHLQHCVDTVKKRVRVDELYGWTAESDEEFDDAVRVTLRSADGQLRTIQATRLIKAVGVRVDPNNPLEFSSNRVRSVSPDFADMQRAQMSADNAPVWIIGGGKTAMDTAHSLITEFPGREINMVAGTGTYFSSREKLFPTGLKRWTGGVTLADLATNLTRRFDGTNEADVHRWIRDAYGVWLTPEAGNYFLGVLSEAENATIAAGLDDVVMDHLVDIVDRGEGTDMVLRSGATRQIAPGSWIVNCTGYLMRTDYPYEPYISAGGRVLSIQLRSVTLQLPSFVAYFMTHLLFLGKIADVPLYELDLQELKKRAPGVVPMVLFTLAQHNLSLISDVVPTRVLRNCGLDFNSWYPLPRQLVGSIRFLRTHRATREHCRRSLDTVRERFDIRCGPLVHAGE